MMGQLVVRNLFHRPMRTLIGVMAVGVEVALVVLIVGLTSGLLQETAKRIEGIGADVMLQSPSAQILLTFSGSPMPIKIADKLREMKYIKAVTPALLQFNSTGGVETIWGIDRDISATSLGDSFSWRATICEGPNDMLIDDWQAKAKHMNVGDTYTLLSQDWNVVGIVEHGKAGRIFVPISTLQELVGAREKASIFLVKCTRPEHTERRDGRNEIELSGLPGSPAERFHVPDDLDQHAGTCRHLSTP